MSRPVIVSVIFGRLFAAICGVAFAVGTVVAQQSPEPQQSPEAWLMQMQHTVEGVNYQGMLVHMRPGHVEQFRVFQRVHAEGITEKLVLVDGMGAEIIRTPDEVMCIFPKQRRVVVEHRKNASSEGPLRASLPSIEDLAPEYYELKSGPDDRVAERKAQTISINPKDNFRYGYRLWLDKATAMPLKSQLVDGESSMPIEEIRFVSIDLPEAIEASAVEPGINTADFTVIRQEQTPAQTDVDGMAIKWAARDLPPGFMLSASRLEFMDGSERPRMHLVYTDGLASVSVFFDQAGEQAENEAGASMMGAANAYTLIKTGLLITAIGEVPARTVKRIAVSVEPVEAP